MQIETKKKQETEDKKIKFIFENERYIISI